MQRIVIESYPYYQALQDLDAKVSLIMKHFPPSVASLYALPKAGANEVLEWWSPLGGQPILYRQLPETEQALLLQKYEQRQQSLRLLIDELKKRSRSEQTASLQSLLGEPNLDNLYSINQDPVLVRWGPPPPPKVKPAPVVSAPNPAPKSLVTPVVQKVTYRRRAPWLLPLLLLLLLGLLLGGLLFWWLNHTRLDHHSCQPAGTTPPEFVTIFDTSYSMVLNLDATVDDENWFFNHGKHIIGGNERTRRLLSAPNREVVAKQAISTMVKNLHPDINARLITFAGCRAKTKDHGIFTQQQRPDLLSIIRGIEMDDGTPLAANLAYAASKVDGRDNDAVIVMFVDGVDGCGGDVCAEAKTIAREQPRLKVNVVNIGSEASESCITSLTGGRTYDSTDAEQISMLLAKATEEVTSHAKCNALF